VLNPLSPGKVALRTSRSRSRNTATAMARLMKQNGRTSFHTVPFQANIMARWCSLLYRMVICWDLRCCLNSVFAFCWTSSYGEWRVKIATGTYDQDLLSCLYRCTLALMLEVEVLVVGSII